MIRRLSAAVCGPLLLLACSTGSDSSSDAGIDAAVAPVSDDDMVADDDLSPDDAVDDDAVVGDDDAVDAVSDGGVVDGTGDDDASGDDDAIDSDASVGEPGDGGAEVPEGDGGAVDACGNVCGAEEYCDPSNGGCVACLVDDQCEDGTACLSGACEPVVACEISETCTELVPVCHSELKRCVECQVDLDCPVEQACEQTQCKDPGAACAMGDDLCSTGYVVDMPGDQAVDGYGDEFCEVPGFELNFQNAAEGASGLSESAVLRVAWSAESLHLYVEVQDADVAVNADADYLWSGDAIQLFLAPTAPAELDGYFTGRVDGVQLVFTPPSEGLAARAARLFWVPNEDDAENYHQVREMFTQGFAARTTATGYAIEAEIKWSSFGPRLEAIANGSPIAFNVELSAGSQASISNGGDRDGAALLFSSEGQSGVNSCGDGDQSSWCNSTTWCPAVLGQPMSTIE